MKEKNAVVKYDKFLIFVQGKLIEWFSISDDVILMFTRFNIRINIVLLLNARIYTYNCYQIQFMQCYSNGYVSISPRIYKVPLLHTNNKTSHLICPSHLRAKLLTPNYFHG